LKEGKNGPKDLKIALMNDLHHMHDLKKVDPIPKAGWTWEKNWEGTPKEYELV